MKSIIKTSLFLFLAGTILMSSCAPAYQKELKSSYKLYNQAVTAESAYRIEQIQKEMVNFNSDATKAQFQSAYKSINDVIDTHKEALGKDNLYGNVLALKAMCELNMESHTDATNTASQALTYLKNSPSADKSRDNALMTAMPGLVKANQLYDQVPKGDDKVSEGQYTNIADLAGSAINDLEGGRKSTDATHPVNEYLLMSKLAVYKTWLDVLYDTVDKDSSDAEKAQKRQREDELMKAAGSDIDALNALVGSKKPAVIKSWKAMIGVD